MSGNDEAARSDFLYEIPYSSVSSSPVKIRIVYTSKKNCMFSSAVVVLLIRLVRKITGFQVQLWCCCQNSEALFRFPNLPKLTIAVVQQ